MCDFTSRECWPGLQSSDAKCHSPAHWCALHCSWHRVPQLLYSSLTTRHEGFSICCQGRTRTPIPSCMLLFCLPHHPVYLFHTSLPRIRQRPLIHWCKPHDSTVSCTCPLALKMAFFSFMRGQGGLTESAFELCTVQAAACMQLVQSVSTASTPCWDSREQSMASGPLLRIEQISARQYTCAGARCG